MSSQKNKKTTSLPEVCDAADYYTLEKFIAEDFVKSGLSQITMKKMSAFPITEDENLVKYLGFSDYPMGSGNSILSRTQVYAITYPDGFVRIKLMTPLEDANGKTVKYLSPSKEENPDTAHMFYLMDSAEAANKSGPLFFTEGEKKCAKIQQELKNIKETRGFCIGFPGVSMFAKCLRKQDKELKLRFSGRKCYIAFDYADYIDTPEKSANADVQKECLKLWLALRKKKAAAVYILFWDDDPTCKGIDDYLVKHKEDGDFRVLMESASENPFEILQLFQDRCGYMRLAECIAGSFYSKEEYKALWQEFDLSSHYSITFETFNDLVVKELRKIAPKEDTQQPFSEIYKTVLSGTKNTQYHVTDKGVFKAITISTKTSDYTEYIRICADAVQITERFVDIFDESAQVKIIWGNKRRKEILVPETWLSGNSMSALTDKGLRIQTPNGKDMAEYFLACLNEMEGEKTFEFASRNGWLNKDCTEFVCGNNIISKDGNKQITYATSSEITIGKSGDKMAWQSLLKPYSNDPLFQIIMGASAASPLLKPLGIESQVFHLYNDSSAGKSFFARFAASLWGKARGDGEIIAGWDATRIGPEQYFAMMNHLPAFLDDSQEATNDEYVRRIAQSYVNGKGRTRGGLQANGIGLAKSPRWHGILISTGEKKITDSSNYSGLAARTVEIYKQASKKISQAEFLDINLSLQENYGFGDEIITHFLNHKDAIKTRIKEIIKILEGLLPDIPTEKARSLGAWAAVIAGAELCAQLFDFNIDNKGITQILLSLFQQDESRGSTGAYEFLLETFSRNRPKFGEMKVSGTKTDETGKETKTYRYNATNLVDGKEGTHAIEDEIGIYHPGIQAVCFYPQKLREILSKNGFSISQVSSILKEKDLLITTKGYSAFFSMKILGTKLNFYAIKLNGFQES